jgi:hypothetical protein
VGAPVSGSVTELMASAYLSGVGVMGRRHLAGLVRAGFDVVADDPKHGAIEAGRTELTSRGLPADRLRPADGASARFDVAIFSETAPHRFQNLRRFLTTSGADRILLEKPISANPAEYDAFVRLAREHRLGRAVQVNLPRRTWPHIQTLMALCADEAGFAVTLNGGAIGLGCMGIHYLDTFLVLCGHQSPRVVSSSLSTQMVASGRGEQFQDYGADFVLQGRRGRMLASLDAASSSNVVMTVRGAHFMATADYGDMRWKLSRRKPDSPLPNYRYGADYEVVEQGALEIPAMDVQTERWALGKLDLPSLAQAAPAHQLLDEILRAGGAQPPYRFT